MAENPYPRQSSFPTQMAIFETAPDSHALFRMPTTTEDGAEYRLFIARPRSTPGPAGHPILYMLDGNAAFDLLTPDLLASVPDLCIVGIGYDTPFRFDATRRSLDFTPPRNGAGPIDDPVHPGRRIGGADAFLDRLCDAIRKTAENGFRVDATRRSLWGHSLGGLLTLYALLSRPGRFDRYIAASPSIWWGDEYLLGFEPPSPPPAHRAEVAIMLGEAERRSSPAAPTWNGPAPATLELARHLAKRADLDVSLQLFPGAVHVASLFQSVPIALVRAAAP